MAVGDIGQIPQAEDLTQHEAAHVDKELTGEADVIVWDDAAGSGDLAGGSCHCRAKITLDATPYLVRQLSWGRNCGNHCCSEGVVAQRIWWLG